MARKISGLITLVLLLLATSWALAANTEQVPGRNRDQAAQTLARILAEKNVITAAELAAVEAAAPDEAVRLLAELLHRKGMLTTTELARVNGATDAQQRVAPQLAAAPVAFPQALNGPSKPVAPGPPVTAQSKLPISVYGTIVWQSFFNTGPTNNSDDPLLAAKKGDPLGARNFGETVRGSRFGFRYQGPEVAGARMSGHFEFDLFGGKAALSNGVGMDLLRLRLAYGRLDWKNVSLLIGQDWSIFAPLNPTTLAGFAIPDFSASGNPWIRIPQLRAELRHDVSDRTRLQWQVAASDPNAGDYPAEFRTLRSPLIGERGRMPAMESRLGMTSRVGDRDFAVGLSSRYGRGKNVGTIGPQTLSRSVDSWGVALDYTLPVHRRVAFTGELFDGRALGIYSVTSGLSVLPPGTAGEHGVQAAGGWFQTQINLAAKWQMNLAYGADRPDISELRTGDRSRNQGYMGNIFYKCSPHLTFSWEWRRFLTDYKNQRAANNQVDHFNLSAAYIF